MQDINDIEFAKQYFLVPIEDQESLFFLGNRDMLQSLLMVMDAPIVATSGVYPETCYLMVGLNNYQCTEIIKKASDVIVKAKAV